MTEKKRVFPFRFFPYTFRCELQDLTPDIYGVSLGKDKCGAVHNFVGITHLTNSSKNTNFTIYLGPLFNIRNKDALVEFVEMHKILGVDKFAFYDHSISAHVLEQLKKLYTKDKIVDILPWKLPVHGRYVYYQGQLGMLNECLYRYMFRTKYIGFIDADERIIPRKEYTWTELINNLEQKLSNEQKSQTCGFSFRNMFFNTNLPDDEESNLNSSIKIKIPELMKTKRNQHIHGHGDRSKTIVNPRMVDLMTVHYVQASYNKKSKLFNVDPSVAALHHYRSVPKTTSLVVDRTTFKYSKDLIERMSRIYD